MTLLIEQILNGLQLGITLFLMSAGLTLVFGIMQVINLAHGSFYMIGAYVGATVAASSGSFLLGVAAALTAAALAGMAVESVVLRQLYKRDHLDQVLATFGLIFFFNELTRMIWGKQPLFMDVPVWLSGNLELLPGLRGDEVVVLQLADLAGEIRRQEVELEVPVLGCLLGYVGAPLVARGLGIVEVVLEGLALLGDHVVEILGDLVVDPTQIELVEHLLPPFAELVEHVAQTLHPIAVGVLEPLLHQAAHRRVEITVVEQVVCQFLEQTLGVVVEPRLGPVPGRVAKPGPLTLLASTPDHHDRRLAGTTPLHRTVLPAGRTSRHIGRTADDAPGSRISSSTRNPRRS